MKKSKKTTRREFITRTGMATAGVALGATSLDASAYNRIAGANDKVNVGFIGIGNRGSQLLGLFMKQPDAQIAAYKIANSRFTRGDEEIIDSFESRTELTDMIKGVIDESGDECYSCKKMDDE